MVGQCYHQIFLKQSSLININPQASLILTFWLQFVDKILERVGYF